MALTAPITKEDFNTQYWFSPLQLVTVRNPKDADYPFMVEMRHFIIKARATESIPGTVANVYLNHMSRIMAQDDDRMELLSDYALRKQYYDSLIVEVKSLVPEYDPTPEYMRNVPTRVKAEAPDDTPPWQQKDAGESEKAPETEVSKEFEYEGAKYKYVVSKDSQRLFFRDGRRITEAEYSKIASMA